jgi:hypothetical protein
MTEIIQLIPFDINNYKGKRISTRDGKKVTILDTNVKTRSELKIAAKIEDAGSGYEYIVMYNEKGSRCLPYATGDDLFIVSPKMEYKDGDILSCNCNDSIFIFKDYPNEEKHLASFYLSVSGYDLLEKTPYRSTDSLYPSTEQHKKRLFHILKMYGKAWDEKNKTLKDIDLSIYFKNLKYFPKQYDRVIGRKDEFDTWKADLFRCMSNSVEYKYIGYLNEYKFCIPYTDETKCLIDTNEEYKGEIT